MDEELQEQQTVNDSDQISITEEIEEVSVPIENKKVYDLEFFAQNCVSGVELEIEEVAACYEFEQKESLEFVSDLFVVSFNIILAVALGYIGIKGLLDAWRN